MMRAGLALIGLTVLAAPVMAQQTDKIISGYGYALTGDTLNIGNDEVRLLGVAAPLLDQTGQDLISRAYPAGLYARDVLASLIAERPISCRVVPQHGSEKDKTGRYYGACATSASTDLSNDMVTKGWAFVDRGGEMPIFTNYNNAEKAAKQRRAGVWQGPMTPPWELTGSTAPEPVPVTPPNAQN